MSNSLRYGKKCAVKKFDGRLAELVEFYRVIGWHTFFE